MLEMINLVFPYESFYKLLQINMRHDNFSLGNNQKAEI